MPFDLSKQTYITYEYFVNDNSIWAYAPITLFDFNRKYINPIPNASPTYFLDEVLKNFVFIMKKHTLIGPNSKKRLIAALSRDESLEHLKLVFIKDEKSIKEILKDFVMNNGVVETSENFRATFERIFYNYISTVLDDHLAPATALQGFLGNNEKSIVLNENLNTMIMEVDYILIYLLSISLVEFSGNVYDYKNILLNNRIRCEKCLILDFQTTIKRKIKLSFYAEDRTLIREMSSVASLKTFRFVFETKIPINARYMIVEDELKSEKSIPIDLENDVTN